MAMNLKSVLVDGFWAVASVAGWQPTPALPYAGAEICSRVGTRPGLGLWNRLPACLWGEPPELRCDPPAPSG